MTQRQSSSQLSPFGGTAELIRTLSVGYIQELYLAKCGVDISEQFRGHAQVDLYQCRKTGYRFWRPSEISGDEQLYKALSHAWPNYYRKERWEYKHARRYVAPKATVLEVAAGQGSFLQSVESRCKAALGLELNTDTLTTKVTTFPVRGTAIEQIAGESAGSFDVVLAFQELEHVVDPAGFLESAIRCLRPKGYLLLSTPNFSHRTYVQPEDAFDLPPHHMGYFDEVTYRRIARHLGVTVDAIVTEPRRFEAPSTESQRVSMRAARVISRTAYNIAFARADEPGQAILAVFQKS